MEAGTHRLPFAVIARESPFLPHAAHRVFLEHLLHIHRRASLRLSPVPLYTTRRGEFEWQRRIASTSIIIRRRSSN